MGNFVAELCLIVLGSGSMFVNIAFSLKQGQLSSQIQIFVSCCRCLFSNKVMKLSFESINSDKNKTGTKGHNWLFKKERTWHAKLYKRCKSYADSTISLKAQLDQQKSVVESLISNSKILKIQEAKSKKDTLKARAQSAKTATKVNEILGNVNTTGVLSAFEKMEEKVLTMESQAEALNELSADELDGKFAMLETSSVDDDLTNLKKELSGFSTSTLFCLCCTNCSPTQNLDATNFEHHETSHLTTVKFNMLYSEVDEANPHAVGDLLPVKRT